MSSSGSILGSTSNSDGTRSTVNTPASDITDSRASIDSNEKITEISAQGDLVLQIEHERKSSKAVHSFRASSSLLAKNSKYFERLLHSGRFSESTKIQSEHAKLAVLYGSATRAPSDELPILEIKDLGRISNVKAIDALLTDLLLILHDKDAQTAPSIINYANLAIAADRFDALDVIRAYFHRKKLIRALDGRTTVKTDANMTEEKARQRLLVALFLDYSPWLDKYSALLITKGWVGKEADTSDPLWWDLPMRIEEELAYRRERILETIQSAQSWALTLYTSRERQCRLGYENSPQCDSFQLGEVVKFFTRVNTLRLQGTITDTSDSPLPYQEDLNTLLDLLRQVPEYQIDKFHSHCGIRTKFIPLLDFLQRSLQHTGICAECWQQARREYAWLDAKRPLLWKRQDIPAKPRRHSTDHEAIRAIFMASERHWA